MEFNLDYEKNQFNDMKNSMENLLKPMIDTTIKSLDLAISITDEPVSFSQRLDGQYRPINVGEPWGQLFQCAWLHLTAKNIKKESNETIYLKLDVSGEAALFDKQGMPIKGFTNGSSVFDRNHGEPGKMYYDVTSFIDHDNGISLWIEAGANDLFGHFDEDAKIHHAELVVRNQRARKLYYDMETLLNLLEVSNKNDTHYNSLFNALWEVYLLIEYQETNWLDKALKITKNMLESKTNNPITIYATGHAHIDLAWLWPIRETRRKAGRTLSNVIDLLKRNDNFIFGISQPQLLVWLEEDYPTLFEDIKHYVKLGRIELQGGMWVEADTNVSGEEALVRQMLYGIKYYQDTFGFRVKNLWLPDVFGYSGAMPQIIKKSGLDYFMTIKLSWSLINRFPYHTFNWEGIDDSNVLTHMPPEGNYNSSILPKVSKKVSDEYREQDIVKEALVLYGIGDGGGGPGEEHIERIQRQRNLAPLPKIKDSRADTFFEKIKEKKSKLPHWKGELYLENHQGTYTSQANVKWFNRKLEQKLKTIEVLLTLDGNHRMFKSTLDSIWKEVLLYQFHDILPGSSIKRVYDECLARYKKIDETLNDLLTNHYHLSSTGKDNYIFNPFDHKVHTIKRKDETIYAYEVNPFSFSKPIHSITLEACENTNELITENTAIKFHPEGYIESIRDLSSNREMLTQYGGNRLMVYIDKGDAWNIKDHYRYQTPNSLKAKPIKSFDSKMYHLRVNHYQFLDSSIKEYITIDKTTGRIEFEHFVDWKNKGYMLRTGFMTTIEASNATFDIQFGTLDRSTENDTRINKAQFEVSAHEWVKMQDTSHTIALMNDSKYGFHIKEGMMDINLLRSTDYPAKNGDIDKTQYKYAFDLYPSSISNSEIDRQAKGLNGYFPSFNEKIAINPLYTCTQENIKMSAIKPQHDEGGIIIRLYENEGKTTQTNIFLHETFNAIYETNLVEEIIEETNLDNVTFKPFEIKTFLLKN